MLVLFKRYTHPFWSYISPLISPLLSIYYFKILIVYVTTGTNAYTKTYLIRNLQKLTWISAIIAEKHLQDASFR